MESQEEECHFTFIRKLLQCRQLKITELLAMEKEIASKLI